MSKNRESRILPFIFVFLLIIVIGSLFYKDRLLDWGHLQPIMQSLLAVMWFTLSLSVLGLITIFIIGQRRYNREKLRIFLLILTISSCAFCLLMEAGAYFEFNGGQGCFPFNANARIAYQPPFLPVSLEINSQGKISLSGDASIVLEIGTISVGADVSHPPIFNSKDATDNGTTTLIIRHYQGNEIVDTKYELHSKLDSVQIVTTGHVVTQLKKNYYFLDASQGNIESTRVDILPVNSTCSVPV